MNIDEFSNSCKTIDWDIFPLNGEEVCGLLNAAVSERDGAFISELAQGMLDDEILLGQAEKNPSLSRLVLFECGETGAKLRFHAFDPLADARPHDHRWPFANLIIGGCYIHEIYAHNPKTLELEPIMSSPMTAGNQYIINSTSYHRTDVKEPTWSFILQGPAKKKTWSRMADSVETYGTSADANSSKRVLAHDEVIALVKTMQQRVALYLGSTSQDV